jgi:hypothetical protein
MALGHKISDKNELSGVKHIINPFSFQILESLKHIYKFIKL